MGFSLFNKKHQLKVGSVTQEGRSLNIEMHEPLKRPGKMTLADEEKLYYANPSIIDYLPWAEYLDDEKCLLLDDGISVGAVYSIDPVPTEGRTDKRLEEIRDVIEDALQDSLEEYDENPWVVQFFCQDEKDVTAYLNTLRNYIRPAAQGTELTEAWLQETERHLKGIARPEGLFKDSLVTGQAWRGQQRRTRMVVYRWLGKSNRDSMPPVEMLNQVCDRLSSALSNAGVVCIRQNGYQIHDWLLRHFNPEPNWIEKDTLYREAAYWSKQDEKENNLAVHNDFAETLWFVPPRSDTKHGVWWFDNKAHGVVNVERLRKAPNPGHLTGEQRRGDKNINTLMDLFPEGTIVAMTIIAQPQDTLEQNFDNLYKNAVGENTESIRVRKDVKTVKEYLGNRHKLYRASLSFLLRANDVDELNRKRVEITSTLLTAGLEPIKPEYDVAPLNGYLRSLPMCFNPQVDKKHWYTRLTWVQHLAGLLPVTGRSIGTGNPGFSFFNRGGDVLTFDPQNKNDRSQNAHLLLFGPTGAGKSATLCSMLSQLMAVHRPRLFIAEAGNSFGLLADYYESLGLTVNKISVKPGAKVSLPPFADAHKLLQTNVNDLKLSTDDLPDITDDEENENEERDILGEMEIAARLMITGGEPDEEKRLTRADRGMIREAILVAARSTFAQKKQMLAEDLQKALYEMSDDTHSRDERRCVRAAEMAEAMSLFTQGFEGELFNQPGVSWPEADVTLIDLGHLAREGYEAAMALTMVSLINTINNIAERDQYLERDINFVVDEAHILTTNPLLSPYMTKVVKMWRKLGAWLWLATQNLEDYPDIAAKMLNMAEWWICLTMPQKEVEDIARFKTLSEEQKAVLRSASKLPRCYTEGVVLSKKIEALFRAVPPSLYLALGMTEKEEKAERRELMRTHNCNELKAAYLVAAKLDDARGLPSRGGEVKV
ncbi:conjugative transfer ATPase [Xenorhabdus khoisanae]|uniref:conjugative transfer ATPase n=1 Tax=Xenorhabdus khoisanae TaxID=880157 RepID=UPI003B58AD69